MQHVERFSHLRLDVLCSIAGLKGDMNNFVPLDFFGTKARAARGDTSVVSSGPVIVPKHYLYCSDVCCEIFVPDHPKGSHPSF